MGAPDPVRRRVVKVRDLRQVLHGEAHFGSHRLVPVMAPAQHVLGVHGDHGQVQRSGQLCLA